MEVLVVAESESYGLAVGVADVDAMGSSAVSEWVWFVAKAKGLLVGSWGYEKLCEFLFKARRYRNEVCRVCCRFKFQGNANSSRCDGVLLEHANPARVPWNCERNYNDDRSQWDYDAPVLHRHRLASSVGPACNGARNVWAVSVWAFMGST